MNLEEALNHSVFKVIGECADEVNQRTFIIGGFVRDYLLKRNQHKNDYDIVTEGSGIELAKRVAKKLDVTSDINVFKRFGTAMFCYQNIDLEFVGARKESYSKDSRKPAVENGTLQDDQNRRDFTINAMAIELNSNSYGNFIDPFNGLEDLNSKILRTPLDPDITYSDDPLRMMRAVRFATQLGFTIEENSIQSIKRQADRLKIVSIERVMDEFNKIMMADEPSIGLILLDKLGLLKHILPEIIALKGIEEIDGQSHKDNFYHTFEVVDNISKTTDKLWLRWAALLHDIGKAPTKKFDKNLGWTFHSHEFVGSKMIPKIFKRLKLPLGNTLKYVQKIVLLSARPIPLVSDDASDAALRRLLYDSGEDLEDLFLLCKADITTKNQKKQNRYQQNFEKVEKKIKEVEERDHVRNFQPPISGEEIMSTFNLNPGREVGIIKKKIKEAILDGELANEKEEAKKYMLKLGKKLNLMNA